jgi:hypothetical protein
MDASRRPRARSRADDEEAGKQRRLSTVTHYTTDSFSPLDPELVKAAGYTGMFRYVAPTNDKTRPKIITRAQTDAIRRAGLDLTLNFEWFEGRPLDGSGAGQIDAHTADAVADAVGYPRQCAIYYSVDFGVTQGQISTVLDYFQGVNTATKRPVGIYAGTTVAHPVMRADLARFFWQANAASWSGFSGTTAYRQMKASPSPLASLIQHIHADTPLHIPNHDTQFDPNTILKPNYGQWAIHPQLLEEDEMFRIIRGEQAPQFWLTNWLEKRHVESPQEADAIIKAGITNGADVVTWPQVWIDNIPIRTK